ncbi:polyketide synthase [Eremomyces bilateralis CBS 781.70]|uniref:Polyketide synthase n=1 Tax=Eremomyces bilateralis CBS 781.70 TaxID=1392243 RepID=A0A6G1FZP1_9PEZI|nr:polyketide synthase [Eremomyces bilateralis CBS 781.70]KAF1811192.1 polyketide synthase [Eremomyces bilateralis CBS 781.70]
MASESNIYLFGDQTAEYDAGIRRLLHDKTQPFLSTFFSQSYQALRQEIGSLTYQKRSEFPRHSSLVELLSRSKEGKANPALETAFTCIHQLGLFISECNNQKVGFPSESNTHLLGLCTGLLSAVAVSGAHSVQSLVGIAVETVLLSFRAGLLAADVKERIGCGTEEGSWSVLVPNVSVAETEALLQQYIESNALPPSVRPYVSAVALKGLTISGSPSTLQAFLQSEGMAARGSIKSCIYAPYHAPELYSKEDVDTLLSKMGAEIGSRPCKFPVISNLTGKSMTAPDLKSAYQMALEECLTAPLRLDKIHEEAPSWLAAENVTKAIVHPIATVAAQGLVQAMEKSLEVELRRPGAATEDLKGESCTGKSKIAIVGMSGRFPEANSTEAFWDLLHQGLDVHQEAPATRWDVKTHVSDDHRKNTSMTPYGCWIQDAGLFDARFFNMSPREAPQVDPAQRLALLTAYEALEMAGIVPDATPSTQRDRVGVFYGMTSNDWCETNSPQNIDAYFIPGGNRAFTPGRINYYFKFSGPSYSVDTACSSSLAAIHVACNSLWIKDCDTAIAGGTNIMTNPDVTAGLDRGHFLSRTGNCQTFDDGADGYCRGDGVGTLILKRMEDAIADKDPILGVILSASTNHSAEAESITRPHVGAQTAIFDKLLNETNVDPYDIDYIEMHGTGTQAGDAREMESVLTTFAPTSNRKSRSADQSLHLGSAKANVGHGESASGVTALVKLLLMLQKNTIPPHVGIKNKINHNFPTDMEQRNVFIAREAKPWKRDAVRKRRALVNNFSAAGGNSSVLVEDAPLCVPEGGVDRRTVHPVAISAKCADSLTKNIESLIKFLREGGNGWTLPQLSYTTTARRMHHPHRVIVSGTTVDEVRSKLQIALEKGEGLSRPKGSPNVVFAFTGQGAQHPGMSKDFYNAFSSYRTDIDRYDRICQVNGFPSILPYILSENADEEFSPFATQLATTSMQMALVRLWTGFGIFPSAVVGHSLGEYAALNAAGVISEADTIFLVGNRASLLDKLCSRGSHSMLAIKSKKDACDGLLKQAKFEYEIACLNGPDDTVICGENASVDAIADHLKALNIKATKLNTAYAFHSRQVEPILDSFEDSVSGVRFHAPAIPVLCPLIGKVVTESGVFSPQYLRRHCREPVDMLSAVREAASLGNITANTTVIEIGPQPVVSGMIRASTAVKNTLSTMQRNKDPWKILVDSLDWLHAAGADVRWAEYHRDFKSSQAVVPLPAYNWNLQNYWIQYVNDWSLRKGDPPLVAAAPTPPPMPQFENTCVQKKLLEKKDGKKVQLVFETDLLHPDLAPIVRGHKVNGVSLCTPSVYAEIGLTVGKYLLAQYKAESQDLFVDVGHMTVEKPLIAKASGPQPLRTTVEFDTSTDRATLRFCTGGEHGEKLVEHSHCVLSFTDSTPLQEYRRNAYLIKSRMSDLKKGVVTGETNRFNCPMAYRIVSALAQYDSEYRGVQEVILHSANREATSKVSFAKTKVGGTWTCHPCYIDSLGQTGGFVMNANDDVDLDVEVFVNHGWRSMQIFEAIDGSATYQTHVKMHEAEGGNWEGDVYVLNDKDDICAIFKGIVLQGVPRRLLDYILAVRDDSKSAARPVAAAPSSDAMKISVGTPEAEGVSHSNAAKELAQALNILSEESGVALSDLTDDSKFADMGVDSLLALIVASRFREELGIDLDSSLFVDFGSVKAFKDWFLGDSAAPTGANPSEADAMLRGILGVHGGDSSASASTATRSPSTTSDEGAYTDTTSVEGSSSISSPKLEIPPATSVILQGLPKASKKTLFLFPDGCGSSMSYAQVPRISNELLVVGLNCPFMKTPQNMKCSIDEITAAYIHEIRRRQPQGPYHFGGWSAGGIFAHNAALRLIEQGEEVETLILIDSPLPMGLDKLPKHFYDYCDDISLFGEGTGKAPDWLVPHFLACVDVLNVYYAPPLPPKHAPKTHMIWACDNIFVGYDAEPLEPRAGDPEKMKFFTESRTDFSPNGWDELVGSYPVKIERMQGANHFTMMRGEQAAELARFLDAAMA